MGVQELDYAIEKFGHKGVVISLRGFFSENDCQRFEKDFSTLVEDGCRLLLVDVDQVEFDTADIANTFLSLANEMKGRGGRLVLIARRDQALVNFKNVRNLVEIAKSVDEINRPTLIQNLKAKGVSYSRRTGIRLSMGMAIVFFALLAGWGLTLLKMIQDQENTLKESKQELSVLALQRDSLAQELKSLKGRLEPLKQLGLMGDSLKNKSYRYTKDVVQYRAKLNKRKGDTTKLSDQP